MSTKTIYKRIALVAVATLGAGLLSVAPANAAASSPVISDPTDGYVASGSVYTASTVMSFTGAGATDSATLTASVSGPAGSTATTVTFGTATAVSAGGATFTPATGVLLQGATANGSVTATVPLLFTPVVAGSYTITITNTGGTAVTQSYTVKVGGLAYVLGDGAAVTPATSGNGIAGPANTVTVNSTTDASNTRSLVTVAGAGATINSNGGNAVAAGVTSTIIASGGTTVPIIINTPTAGTVTVSQFYESGNGTGIYASTASKTATITVGAAALNGAISVANSTSFIDGTIGADNEAWSTITADETVLVTSAASASLERAVIKVVLKDTLTNFMPDATGISAVISGPGLLAISTTQPQTAVGRAVSSATLASGTGTAFVSVYSDGTEGVGTITISVGTTVVATETVSFYGTATKYVAVVKKQHIANSGSSTADVVEVTATDKAGNLVPSSTILASVGTSTTATVTSSVATGSTGKALFAMTGLATKFGAVVVTFADSATTPKVTTTATVGVSSARAVTAVAASDKAIYAPGEKITWTLTFKDANGLGIPDGTYTAGDLLKSDAANPVASASLASTPFVGNVNLAVVAGVATATGFAPLASGPLTFTWTLRGTVGDADSTNLVKALQGTTVTVTATVENPEANAATDAANEATDAANAATDAALAAADAADAATAAAQDAADAVAALSTRVSTLVSNLRKQITALTKLVQRLL